MCPAAKLWAATVATVLVLDALLIHRRHETMSQWYGRHARVLAPATVYLLLHLHGWPPWLRRCDPLSLIAKRLARIGAPD